MYRLKVALTQPATPLAVLALIVFTYLIAAPVILLLMDAVHVHFADQSRAHQLLGEFTLYYFQRAFTSIIAQKVFWMPMVHTGLVAVGVIVLALAIGGSLGWLLSRTNIWGRRWLATALLIPYIVPSWTFALAWVSVFKNRTTGGLPGWLETLGFAPPDWLAYGQLPITIVLGLHYAPFVIMLFGNALRQMDSQLEDAARLLGAGRMVIATRIILPLMLPSIVSAVTLIFAKCLGDFGVTYVLGMPVGFDVLATSLFRTLSTGQAGMSAVIAGAIILLGAASVLIDIRLLKEAKRFVTIGTKGAMYRRNRLGAWRLPATAFAVSVFLIGAVMPLAVLFLTTVMRVPGIISLDNFTLDFWTGHNLNTTALTEGILLTDEFWMATWNTVWIVGSSAICAGFLGLFVGYVVVRSPSRFLGNLLRQITFLPYLVPGIAFAAAYLSMFAVPRWPVPALYGTPAILILALLAGHMPFASRAGISAMMQLGKEPEEAAQIAGSGWWRRMFGIVIPIQRSALTSGVVLSFISGVKGLSLVVMLAVPGTDLLTTYTIRLVDYGYSQAANAVVLMICAVALVGTLLAQTIGGGGLSESTGGN